MHLQRLFAAGFPALVVRASAASLAPSLGVAPADAAKYAGPSFRCFNGEGAPLPASAVNDLYCDCADGSDEPGTGACAGQETTLFFCPNKGSTARTLYASRIGDGICDCCDGSDEAALAARKPTLACTDVCLEQGAREKEELQRRADSLRRGVAKREEIAAQAIKDRVEWQKEVEILEKGLPALEKAYEEAKAKAEVVRKQEEEARAAKKKREEEVAKDCLPTCMWRQTGGCIATGTREEAKDMACNKSVPKGSSGFCDCDGDGVKAETEKGFDCSGDDRVCCQFCSASKDGQQPATAAAEGVGEAATEEKVVSEYAKWMDGAEKAMDKEAKEDKVVSEYTKWMDGAETAMGDKAEEKVEQADEKDQPPEEKTASDLEREARLAVNDNKDETKKIQQKIDALSDDHLGYASLAGKTLSKHIGEFDYKVSFFADAKQGHTSLGKWDKWTGKNTALFSNGQTCWSGPARQLDVKFQCGIDEALEDVSEPSRCVYEAVITHPGACDPEELASLSSGDRVIGPRDEL